MDFCTAICSSCFFELRIIFMLCGAIFDLDGVLADSHPIHFASWRRFLSSVGISVSQKDLEIVRDGRTKEALLRHFMGDLSEHELRRYAAEKDRIYCEHIHELAAVRGVPHLLHELQTAGIVLAVASSGSFRRVHHTLDLLQISTYFQVVNTADEFISGKATSAMFAATAERMQVQCEHALVFEDSEIAIRSARAIGMKCIGIADRLRATALIQAGAEYVLPNFLEISLAHLQSLFSAGSEPTSASHAQTCSV
jgi:HAD superfamily hydrolase (TIGR01509 family)